MGARTSGRQHNPVNYNEKAGTTGGGGGPAWAREIGGAEAATQRQPHKENSAPAGAAAAGKKGGATAGRPARKSAPAVPQKGRNAGLERVPIEDVKPASNSADHVRARSTVAAAAAAAPAAAGKEVLPGVRVKAVAAGATAPAKQAEQPSVPAAAPGGSKSGPAKAAPPAKSGGSAGRGAAAALAAAAKPSSGGSSSGKRKAAAPPAAADETKPAAKSGQPDAPAQAAGQAKRQKSASAAPAPEQQQEPLREQAPAAAAAARGVLAGGAGDLLDVAPPPGSGAEQLVEFYSINFQALQAEYARLQAEYEDLKAAKIDEEVQHLLEQQNRHVTEHGQKAAQLVEHYKAEAEHQADTAAELGGEALVEQCRQLQADLMNCQQALLDKEAESLEKERQLAAMQARLAYLERYARVYKSADKCIQTDEPPHASASAQFPSLQSSGVEMLQAHALVPEGAGGGSIYRQPRPDAAARPEDDPSYTLPGLTPLPAGAAAAAAAAGAAMAVRSPVMAGGPAEASAAGGAAAAAAAAVIPVSGSDMQLTGGDDAPQAPVQLQQLPEQEVPALQQLQQQPPAAPLQQQAAQQQQRRRHSLQPVSGRLAHAVGAPAPAPVLRPASAESQVQPSAAAAAAGGRQQQQRGPGAAQAGRRVSAPPAPLGRELHFSSNSTAPAPLPLHPGQRLLAAVPEEHPLPSAAGAQPALSPRHREQQPAGSVSTVTAPVSAAAATAATPASVPAPPRDQAITALTGIVATPLKGGVYQYTEPRYGFVFQLAPASPDSADMTGEENCAWLCYRPITLGATAQLLPDYLRSDITFKETERPSFFFHLLNALHSKP